MPDYIPPGFEPANTYVPPGFEPTEKRKEPTWADTIISGGLRVIPSLGGALLGGTAGSIVPGAGTLTGGAIGGATGSLLGETAAETYEKWRGLRDEYNPWQIATQGTLGAIPGFGKVPGANATAKELLKYASRAPLKNAVEGSLMNVASEFPTEWAETGGLPSAGQLAGSAVVGGLFGAGTGYVFGSRPARARAKGLELIAKNAETTSLSTPTPTPTPEPVPFMSPQERAKAPVGTQSLFDFAKVPEYNQPSLYSMGDLPPAQEIPPVPEMPYGADIGPYGLGQGQENLPFDENGQLNLGLNVVRPDHAVPVGSFAPPKPPPPTIPPPPPPPPTVNTPPPSQVFTPPVKPFVAPHGVTVSENGHIATIMEPSAGASKLLEEAGYVPVPGLVHNGRIQMVRKDVAPLYVGKPPLPGGRELTPFEQQMRKAEAAKNAAAGPPTGKLVAGDVVSVPNEKVTDVFAQGMEESGYKVVRKDGERTVFRKFTAVEPPDDVPLAQASDDDFSARFEAENGRPPTTQELQQELFKRGLGAQPGEVTGRVAPFTRPESTLGEIPKPTLEEILEMMDIPGADPITGKLPQGEQSQVYPPGLMVDDDTDYGFQSFPNKGQPGSEEITYLTSGSSVPDVVMDPRRVSPIVPDNMFIPRPLPEGQMELPWSRGENPLVIDGDAESRARYMAAQRFKQFDEIPSQGSMEGQMKDAEIQAYLRGEDATPPEMRDLSTYRGLDELKARRDVALRNNDLDQVMQLDEEIRNLTEPSFARAKGGGLVMSMNAARGIPNITKDYSSNLAYIMPREGLQNAMDAAFARGEDGLVRVRIDSDSTNGDTIEIYDNGAGMDEDTLANILVDVFSTGKEGDPNAIGGKGIGSASYLVGGKEFRIDTVAVDSKDGLKYRIRAGGTPEQMSDPVKGSDWQRIPVTDDTPTGTIIKFILKDDQKPYMSREMVDNIIEYTRDKPGKIEYDRYGVTMGNPIDGPRFEVPDYTIHKNFNSTKDDKYIGGFTYKNNKVEFYVPTYDPSEERMGTTYRVLNNGMYQFSGVVANEGGVKAAGIPDNVIINIKPQVDETHVDYPFTNTRENTKNDLSALIHKYVKNNLTSPAVTRQKNRTQELYDTMGQLDVPGMKRRPLILDPGKRLAPEEVQALNNNPLVINMLKFYDSLVENIINLSGRTEWGERLEGVGLSFDPGSHGLHIPNPTTGKSSITFNPFIRIADGMTPRDAAYRAVGTGQHEVAHIGNETGAIVEIDPESLDDPRVGIEYFQAYMNELATHGDVYANTGHGMGFVHRLGEVYATFGAKRRINATEALTNLYTGGNKSGGYSPEIQKLLQLYSESRGRNEVTEDLLTRTGVKQANTRSTGATDIPGAGKTDGDGTSARDLASEFKGRPWARIKHATGWGQGQSGKEPGKHKEANFIKEALSVPTNATTMLDASAPGRQGLPLILTPEFWKAAYAMFKGISYDGFKQIDADLRAKPIMIRHINEETGKLEKSFGDKIGTKLFSPASEPGPRAESTSSRWLEMGYGEGPGSKAWRNTIGYPIRATNRMYITFLNHLNVNRTEKLLNLARDMAMEGVEKGKVRQGILPWASKISPEDAQNLNPYHNLVRAKEIADFVNTATGHGPLKTHLLPYKKAEVSLESATDKLSYFLFSPGLLSRNVRMMNPNTYIMASPFVRKQYLKAAVSTAAAWFVASELIKNAAGPEASVGMDPTSADFGKVRLGNARLDLGGGFLQFATAYARLYQGGSTSSASNEFHRFGSGYQAQTQEDMMQRFFVNKLNPVTKFVYDIASASEYNPFHVGDRTVQLFVPLIVQDLMELHEEDPSLVPWMGTAAAFGGGTQVYSKGESVSKFLEPDNDWLVTGGGLRDLMPWNYQDQ